MMVDKVNGSSSNPAPTLELELLLRVAFALACSSALIFGIVFDSVSDLWWLLFDLDLLWSFECFEEDEEVSVFDDDDLLMLFGTGKLLDFDDLSDFDECFNWSGFDKDEDESVFNVEEDEELDGFLIGVPLSFNE